MRPLRAAFASLTARLVVTAVALVAIVVILIASAATLTLRAYLSDRLDADVAASLTRLQPDLRGGGFGDGDDRGAGTARDAVTAGANGSDTAGLLSGDEGDRTLTPAQARAIVSVTPDGSPHDVTVPGLGSYRVAAVRGPVSVNGGPASAGVAAVGLPTSGVDGPVSQLIGRELLFGVLGVAVAAGAGTYVVRRQLRPLREVAATAHTAAAQPLAEGDIAIATRVPEHLTDAGTEVGQVGSALNTLLEHVESSLAQRHRSEQQVRQFVADASHELRTPLTTIAGYTELARRHPDDPGATATALAKVEEESARMTAMVEDLLLLARLDAGRPLACDTVALSRLLVEAVDDARVVAPDHHWRLELPEESLEVTGAADRLHQVVTNLLANARTHTPAGTTVTVTGAPYGFTVHDDGPGFPPGIAGAAFERFVRGDASRTRTAGTDSPHAGGAGLGLALVAAIVSAHGGSVALSSAPGSTTVRVGVGSHRDRPA